MSLLTCHNVSFSYEGNVVLSDVNFEVNSGDYICIIGENGAGKSTLMKGILNLKKSSGGEIMMGDNLLQKDIGYLPQQTSVQKDFPASVYEVVLSGRLNKLGFRLFYGNKDRIAARDSMKQLGICGLKDKCYRELSGGQQQRVLLARAVCSGSRMIMLDEPVTGLDPVMTNEMYELIHTLNTEENMTIIMVSHDVKSTIKYATHILHLSNKQIFYGKKEDYLKTTIADRFLGKGEYYD